MEDQENNIAAAGSYLIRTLVRVLAYVIAALIILKCASMSYDFGYAVFGTAPKSTAEAAASVTVTVEEEDSVRDVGKKLKEAGLIDDANVFAVQEKLYATSRDEIRPGTYILDTSQTVEEMLKVLFGYTAEDEDES